MHSIDIFIMFHLFECTYFLWNHIWDVENRWSYPATTLNNIKNYKNIIQLQRLLLLHFNICGLVRREIRRSVHAMWWLLNVRHPSTKRKWWIWSSLNAISCANKSQSKVHHSSYLRAHFIAFSSEWMPHTLSLCQTKFTHMSVDWRQGIHTLTQCMRIKEKFFLYINSISSFIVAIAVVFTWHTVGVCMGSCFLLFGPGIMRCVRCCLLRYEPHAIISAMWNFQPVMYH